jgi:hypothetical protein
MQVERSSDLMKKGSGSCSLKRSLLKYAIAQWSNQSSLAGVLLVREAIRIWRDDSPRAGSIALIHDG